MQNRIPVVIITGFLGSGKTTVLNHLLRDPGLTDTAVIVNEFGEIGLDHLLVERAVDQMVLLENGCVCCSVRGDLVDTLGDLMRRVADGSVPAFRRVMIETTGLADPAPIMHTLVNDDETAQRFALQGVVTTLDGVSGVDTLKAFDEARSQVAMADAILITKADMQDADVFASGRALAALNRDAVVAIADRGVVDPAIVMAAGTTSHQVRTPENHASKHAHVHEHGDGHEGHLWNIRSVSIVIEQSLPWAVLAGWLEWLTAMRGPDVLRIKGIVRVEEFPNPILIQGVQHVFHPPRILPDWPDDDHRSRLIVIARDMPEAALRASFQLFLQRAANSVGTAAEGRS